MRLTTIEPRAQQRAVWLAACSTKGMRALIWFLVLAAIIGGFVVHRQHQAAAAAVAASATPAPRPATSKYNLPKRALDRANEVKRQVAEERKSNEVP